MQKLFQLMKRQTDIHEYDLYWISGKIVLKRGWSVYQVTKLSSKTRK